MDSLEKKSLNARAEPSNFNVMGSPVRSLTTQALDMFFGDEAIQSRIVKPLKRRAVPFVIGSLLVNLLLVALLLYLVLRVECLSRFVRGMQVESGS